MTIIYIILACIAFFALIYLGSRLQMKAWLSEIDNVLNDKLDKYLPKQKKDDKV